MGVEWGGKGEVGVDVDADVESKSESRERKKEVRERVKRVKREQIEYLKLRIIDVRSTSFSTLTSSSAYASDAALTAGSRAGDRGCVKEGGGEEFEDSEGARIELTGN